LFSLKSTILRSTTAVYTLITNTLINYDNVINVEYNVKQAASAERSSSRRN